MRCLISLVIVAALILGISVPVAHAGSAISVALGLASFAVFNQLIGPLLYSGTVHAFPLYGPRTVIHTTSTVYPAPAPVVLVQPSVPSPPPPPPTVVQYPHGRYELRADGTQYRWVWIPNPPPPPPAVPPAPSPPQSSR